MGRYQNDDAANTMRKLTKVCVIAVGIMFVWSMYQRSQMLDRRNSDQAAALEEKRRAESKREADEKEKTHNIVARTFALLNFAESHVKATNAQSVYLHT